MESRHASFGIWPFLFVGLPGCPKGRDCFVPFAGGVVLAVGGVDSGSVGGGVGFAVRCIVFGRGRRRVGGGGFWPGARRVVFSRAVDPHGLPSLRNESRRSQDEL